MELSRWYINHKDLKHIQSQPKTLRIFLYFVDCSS